MQQKVCSRGSGSFLLERNGQPCGTVTSCDLPFRCPRCGEHERFRSLASLRAHLEYRHSYRSPDVNPGGFSITGKLPDPLTAAIPWHDMSLPSRRGQQSAWRPPHVRSLSDSRDSGYPHSYSSVRRRTQSVGVGTQAEEDEEEDDDDDDDEEEEFGSEDEEEEDDDDDDGEERDGGRNEEEIKMLLKKSDTCHHHLNHHHHRFPSSAPLGPPPRPELDLDLDLVEQNSYSGLDTAAASAAVRRRLARILRAADSTMQRRLAKVSTDLAQTDTELLCERAHSQHLAQERQEVADRERSLSRQVDVAVMVIAALREQLNASENELERREREVITIQKFLEAAARQETCGKVRIQRFIENLLRRIALAERLVEYYQVNGSQQQCSHYKYQQPTDNGPHRITKSRSAGGQLSSSGLHDNRTHSSSSSSQFGGHPLFSKPGGGERDQDRDREHRERLAQSSRLFCRPEHRDDIWNHQRRRSAGYEA
ncbi:protein ZNF365 [Cyclopterus lumpus]|uniref:Zinc finger protein 365 n=1 Tax=Cyclopterus lumpus TaxID=8103 RepID=A0A8C3ARE0_CYCLU|nr:protein ZNF365 [Cyclopterus lumpus]XP_034408255.1 protein ZNF365 [Cyclopterus lumpus]